MKHITLALLLAATPALAEKHVTEHAIYGAGTETCQIALTHDWLAQGEVAWVSGFMTSSSMAAEKHDILPDHSTQDLVSIVFAQCQAHPFDTLSEATEIIMWRLWDKQQPPAGKGERF